TQPHRAADPRNRHAAPARRTVRRVRADDYRTEPDRGKPDQIADGDVSRAGEVSGAAHGVSGILDLGFWISDLTGARLVGWAVATGKRIRSQSLNAPFHISDTVGRPFRSVRGFRRPGRAVLHSTV